MAMEQMELKAQEAAPSSLEFRILRDEGEDLDAWLDLCDACFRSCRGYFEEHYRLDPERDRTLVFVALDGAQMVGSVRVFVRKLQVRGHGLQTMAGIGEVCTLASYRGKGISKKLMSMALDEAQRRGFSVSQLLSAPGVDAMYRKLGYDALPFVEAHESWERTALDAAAAAWPHKVLALEELDFSPVGAAGFVPELYASNIERFTGPMGRNADYWASWVARQSQEGQKGKLGVVSTAADGSARAFLLVGFPKSVPEACKDQAHSLRLKVLDFLCEPDELSRSALGALAACAARVIGSAASRGGSMRGQHVPPDTLETSTATDKVLCRGTADQVAAETHGSVLLCKLAAAHVPAALAAPTNGVTRHEVLEDGVMYKRLCASDAVWNALASANPGEHVIFSMDDY